MPITPAIKYRCDRIAADHTSGCLHLASSTCESNAGWGRREVTSGLSSAQLMALTAGLVLSTGNTNRRRLITWFSGAIGDRPMSFVFFVNGLVLVFLAVIAAGIALVLPTTRGLFGETTIILGLTGAFVAIASSSRLEDLSRRHAFILTGSVWITAAAAGSGAFLDPQSGSKAYFREDHFSGGRSGGYARLRSPAGAIDHSLRSRFIAAGRVRLLGPA